MYSEFKLGFAFIVFGLFCIFGVSPEQPAGKVVAIIMGIVFMLVGVFYSWIGFKRMENDK